MNPESETYEALKGSVQAQKNTIQNLKTTFEGYISTLESDITSLNSTDSFILTTIAGASNDLSDTSNFGSYNDITSLNNASESYTDSKGLTHKVLPRLSSIKRYFELWNVKAQARIEELEGLISALEEGGPIDVDYITSVLGN